MSRVAIVGRDADALANVLRLVHEELDPGEFWSTVGERWGTRQSKAQGVQDIVSACVESVKS